MCTIEREGFRNPGLANMVAGFLAFNGTINIIAEFRVVCSGAESSI